MHALLIVGGDPLKIKSRSEELAKKIGATILEFRLNKIDDVRDLNSLIRLSLKEPTLIISENIHEATPEALNAFLKNLEEPQPNLYFVLTAPTARKVLPTIVSRCQIVKIKNQTSNIKKGGAETFLRLSVGEKLCYIDKIRDRDKAVELVENSIEFMHQILHSHSQLHSDRVKYSVTAKNIELAIETLTRLKSNGNVNLQMTNFITNYE